MNQDYTEEPLEATPMEQCARSPDFWYDEGNVILRVENTLFRVHRGLLSTHSEVFKDAFGMHPPTDIVLYEGCQVVTQNFDALEDWQLMLTFIYQPLKVNPIRKDLPADTLFSLMRLGKKYMFDDVFNACLERLLSEFPITLDEFDIAHPLRLGVGNSKQHFPPYTRDVHTLISVINQALDLGIECVLPCAYYVMMTQFQLHEITKGTVLPDGTRIVLRQIAKESILTGMAKVYPSVLDSYSRWLYDITQDEWIPHCTEEASIWNSEMEEGDRPWPDCSDAIPAIHSRLLQFVRLRKFALASCRSGEYLFDGLFSDLCTICKPAEMKILQQNRVKFWEDLPAFFDVGESWNSLKHYPISYN